MLTASEELTAIVLALLTVLRETRGTEWCERRGIGKMRETVEAAGQVKASKVLAAHCTTCGRCELGRVISSPRVVRLRRRSRG
jgi:hypothetical protein